METTPGTKNKLYRSGFRIIKSGASMRTPGRIKGGEQRRDGDADPAILHKSHSWRILSDTVAVKRMDRSSFIHHEMAVPVAIRPFFGLETMSLGEKRPVGLSFGVIEYQAYFEMLIEKNPRTRLVWKSDLQNLIQDRFPAWTAFFRSHAESDDTAPEMKIKKTRSPSKFLLFFEEVKRSSTSLELLKTYSREELKDTFQITDAIIRNGIHVPRDTSSVWLFVTEERSPDGISFRNHFDGQVLQLEGQFKGRIGGLITNHESEGNEIVVLYRRKKRDSGCRYVGRFSCHTHTPGQFIGDLARFILFPQDVIPDGDLGLAKAGVITGTRRGSNPNEMEMDPAIRNRTIRVHGDTCAVCGFNFSEKYGRFGEGYIEVHCGEPSSRGEVDPVTKCVPVCSNCHRMIHRAEPKLTIEELKKIVH